MRIFSVPLSDAQVSALECRLDDGLPYRGLPMIIAAAWDRGGKRERLNFCEAARDGIVSALIDISNAEDGQHEETGDVYAGRAARSLCAVAGKVIKCGVVA